jgi:hypothetical protein
MRRLVFKVLSFRIHGPEQGFPANAERTATCGAAHT